MTLRLDLRHYETLLAVIDHGSITLAAKQLMVTQSALSHRLAEAEKRLGRPLLERGSGRSIRPTPAGLALYQAAQRLIPELERAEADFLRSPSTPATVVRLGVGSYDNFSWFPGFHHFAQHHCPDIVLELAVVGHSPSVQVLDGSVDVVIAPARPVGAVATRTLFEDELVLIVAPKHPLSYLSWIEPEALIDQTYLTYSRIPAPGFENDRFVRPSGISPRAVIVIEQTGAIAQMVAAGQGVSILSRWAMSPLLADGRLVAVSCGPRGLPLEWSALMRPSADQESPEHRIVDLLAAWLPLTVATSTVAMSTVAMSTVATSTVAMTTEPPDRT